MALRFRGSALTCLPTTSTQLSSSFVAIFNAGELQDIWQEAVVAEEGHMARRSCGRRNPFRSCRRKLENSDGDAWRPWENLPLDMLVLIVMKLGLIDFLAFSGVCQPWRSAALSNRKTFLAQKEPLHLTLSNKECTFIDIFDERRRYKKVLGDSSRGGKCVGVSCGYIFIRRPREDAELYLVNPITRHELYFPPVPENIRYFHLSFRAILVYSSWLSKFIVIILCRRDNQDQILFSGSGDSEWEVLLNRGQNLDIVDLAFFKGQVYMLNSDGRMGVMRLNPSPTLHLLAVNRMPSLRRDSRELVSSGERLFMVDPPSSGTTVKREFDFVNMEWMVREDLGESSLFINKVKSSAILNPTNWLQHEKVQSNSTYIIPYGKEARAWYFPHECDNNNLLTDS